MKTITFLFALGLTTLGLFAAEARAAHVACPNCSAIVTFDGTEEGRLEAAKFAEEVSFINSMPLSDEILVIQQDDIVMVEVVTDPRYATTAGITSFQVADRALAIALASHSSHLLRVLAVWEHESPLGAQRMNVGTIGH